jgi:hypothetical protein
MQDLTVANIEIIIEEVSRAGITLSHLRDELIDHLCCQVEDEMQTGLTFDKAFEKVKSILGNKGLRKVQEDTLFLIDKKYRIMKKTMKIFGMVSMSLIALGAIFKIQHWPGAGIMLIVGFLLLITVFFPSALWVMKKESKLKGIFFIYLISIIGGIFLMCGFLFKLQHYPGSGILMLLGYSILALILVPAILIALLRDEKSKNLQASFIIGAISLMFYLFGQLFKIQHYAGANVLLIAGAIGLTTIFLPVYAYKVFKNSENVKAGFIYLCFGIFFFNFFSFMLSMNVSIDVLRPFVIQCNENIKTTNFLESKNDRLYSAMISENNINDTLAKAKIKSVKAMSDELCEYIENIKVALISTTNNISNEDAAKKAKDVSTIYYKDNYDFPTYYMLEKDNNGKAFELLKKIEKFKNDLFTITTFNESAKTIILKLLDTPKEIVDKDGKNIDWEYNNFYYATLISVENTLSSLQRNVRISENEALENIANYSANNTKVSSEKSNKLNQ